MSQATLETVEHCADGPIAASLEERLAPDRHVLAVLQGIPEVECLLAGPIASWHSSFGSLHSRRWHRIGYNKALFITPLDDDTGMAAEPGFLVRGRDISLSGISFSHPHPLASRRVIVQFPSENRSTNSALVASLRWCRFRRDGFYQSGGQFVRALPVDDGWPLPAAEGEPALAAIFSECSQAF